MIPYRRFCFILLYTAAATAHADNWFAGGRTQTQAATLEIYGGIGDMSSLEGRVQETANGGVISGGLDTQLVDLNIDEGSELYMIGGKLTRRWFSLLVEYRQSTTEASGVADSELRLNVDQVFFGGQRLEYLLIPAGTNYDVSADTTWLGIGLRINLFTLNAEGNVRFTPWLHGGAQYISSDFDIDAGTTVGIDVPGFENRRYAVRGSASGEAQLVVPEYGLGGEIRCLLGNAEREAPELTFYGTYKILNYDGPLSDIGVEAEEFDNLNVDYSSLALGVDYFHPLGERVEILIGLYYEQVDSNTVLDSKPGSTTFQREVDFNYTLYGLRAGLRF